MEHVNVAACGIACGECRKFIKGKCPGCAKYDKATWCSIRTCCKEHNYTTCAECTLMPLADCKKFNNFFGKLFKVLFHSDRGSCIARIREVGCEQFAKEMHEIKSMSKPVKQKVQK